MIDFQDFMDRFYNPFFGDIDERPRLYLALGVLCERMPVEVYDELPDVILFAPGPSKHGQCLPIPKSLDSNAAFIYITPRMEEETQEQNNFTVAHEFAHVSLRHYYPDAAFLPLNQAHLDYLDLPNELAADELVKRWGYELPAYRIRP